MPTMASSTPSPRIRIVKLAVLLPIGIYAAVLAGKHASSVLSAAAPPYLFLTVHVIIAVIWKLSDRKAYKPTKPARSAPPPEPEAKSASLDPDESCVAAEDSGGGISPPSVASARAEVGGGGNVSMDDTWRAIVLKKADTWEKTRRSVVEEEVEAAEDSRGRVLKKSETMTSSSVAVTSPAAVADDEWNQRFDAFIKKNYDQIRLQTGGAYSRHVDVVNRAFD